MLFISLSRKLECKVLYDVALTVRSREAISLVTVTHDLAS